MSSCFATSSKSCIEHDLEVVNISIHNDFSLMQSETDTDYISVIKGYIAISVGSVARILDCAEAPVYMELHCPHLTYDNYRP